MSSICRIVTRSLIWGMSPWMRSTATVPCFKAISKASQVIERQPACRAHTVSSASFNASKVSQSGIGTALRFFNYSTKRRMNMASALSNQNPFTAAAASAADRTTSDTMGTVFAANSGVATTAAEQTLKEESSSAQQLVQKIFAARQAYDKYDNCLLNLSADAALSIPANADAVGPAMKALVSAAAAQKKHMVLVTINSTHSSLVKQILDNGFTFHHADAKMALLIKCLSNHAVKDCTYPKYRTAIVGASMVVFNKTMEKVLLVKEKFGQQNLKPPTGTVEYGEPSGTPSKTAVKELLEEVGIAVDPASGILTSVYWGDEFRPGVPDINFAYAYKLSTDEAATKAQEAEISAIKWESTADYIRVDGNKPWVMKKIVQAAKAAIEQQKGWNETAAFYSSGKPISFFSSL